MFKGCIVEESLKDNRIINQFKVMNVHISSDENKEKRWHIYTVKATKKQIKLLAKNMNSGKWYTHFWDAKGNITAIFSSGKMFNFNFYQKETFQDAVTHGLSLGIPKEQLDFLID